MGVTLFLITPGCLWPIGNQSGWGKCWGKGFIKSKTTQITQNMLISCSWVVKNKVVNMKQLYTDRMNGQQVKKLGLRFCQTSSHLPFNCIIVFSRSSPAMTWQLAESLRATCPAFWISIAYVNEKLNKMSLEPKTLQDIALFTGIFYALYISWKTGLEIIELFKLEGNSADCLPQPSCSEQGHLQQGAQGCVQLGLSISKSRGFTISMGNMFYSFKEIHSLKFKLKNREINFPFFF